ncbi:uncharacterized protein LOC144473084 [Augochlora pura]
MINLPYNVPLVTQIMPAQSIPVQTSQNNLQPFHQPQTVTQQMQTSPAAFTANPPETYKPFYQLHQTDTIFANQQFIPSQTYNQQQFIPSQPYNQQQFIPSQPYNQQQFTPNPVPPRNLFPVIGPTQANPPVAQTQAMCGQLPPSIVEQIRSAVSNTAPIFILPSGCHQSASHQQQPPPVYPSNQGGVSPPTGPSTGFNYPPSIYCPPSFVPYPIPLPLYEPFTGPTRGKQKSPSCGCCRHQLESQDPRNYLANPFWNAGDSDEHRCTVTNDDTVCSKRNCPAAIGLQSLASQFLALPGIVSCAATRMILRKVPGSNITNTMEEIMEKALKAIGLLTKDQLLVESRICHQVNALINLHVTTNVPASIIPLLMLIQAKVNVLKAQVENSVNRKVMECQGYGFEVETSGPIDPAVLALKSNAELRQLLAALRQKECDERVNANFAPYNSQRVIAESRLHNVQAKIRQVEAEFDNRRNTTVPGPTLTSQIIRQFSESRCTYGYAPAKLFEPCVAPDSPDPFSPSARNPRRLYIKPYQGEPHQEQPHRGQPQSTKPEDQTKGTSTSEETPACNDTGTGEGTAQCETKDQSVGRRCSRQSCICETSSSEDSLDEDKKKLRPVNDRDASVKIKGRITVVEARFEAEVGHSDVGDDGCRRPSEVLETLEQDDTREIKEIEAEESLKLVEIRKTESDDRGASKVDEVAQDVSEITEDSKEEFGGSDEEEQTVYHDPMIPKRKRTKKCVKTQKKGYANVRVIKAAKMSDISDFTKKSRTSLQESATNDGKAGSDKSDEDNLGNTSKTENVQVVAMMTGIVYNRSAGDLARCMTINKLTDSMLVGVGNSANEASRVDNQGNANNENYACLHAEEISSPKVCDMNDERKRESGLNSRLEEPTRRQSMPTEGDGSHSQEVIEKYKRFPPLTRAKSNTRTTRSWQCLSPQNGAVPDSSKIGYNGITSGPQDTKSENSVASAIRSMIGDRFGWLVDNAPNLQTIFSNLYLGKLWTANGAITLRQSNAEPNKTVITRKDGWILLPTDIDRGTPTNTSESYVPVDGELYRVRKIRHTIIRGVGDKSYVLIGGSASEQLRKLSGMRLAQPSRVRRCFVIRSRLKDPRNTELARPLVSLRRIKMSAKPKRSDRRLRSSEKFCSLSDNRPNTKKDSKVDRREVSLTIDAENGVTADCNAFSDDNAAAESEQVTVVHDYSAEQEEPNVLVERISRIY